MNLDSRPWFSEQDSAIDEAQFLVDKHRIPYSIVKVKIRNEFRLYVVPTEIVMEVFLLETFMPARVPE